MVGRYSRIYSHVSLSYSSVRPFETLLIESKTTKDCCFQYVLVRIDECLAGWRSITSLTHLYIEISTRISSRSAIAPPQKFISRSFWKSNSLFEFQSSQEMKTMLPYRNDRNSIRITRKIKIKNRQRESSFDMNVSLAREESKAGFIQWLGWIPG